MLRNLLHEGHQMANNSSQSNPLQTPVASKQAGMDHEQMGPHGSLPGHILPGTMFIIWAFWWMFSVFVTQARCKIFKKEFQSRPWYLQKFWVKVPLEPIIKCFLALVGVFIELSWGQDRYRYLKGADGLFDWVHMNNQQHAAMYGAVLLSGFVDIIGFYQQDVLPQNTENTFLSIAFLTQALLLAFHLKGSALDRMCHFVLALLGFSTSLFIILEIQQPQSVWPSMGKIITVYLQGTWFIQVGYILYGNMKEWDQNYPGGEMYAPVVFVIHILVTASFLLLAYIITYKICKRMAVYQPLPTSEPEVWKENGHKQQNGHKEVNSKRI